VSATGGDNHADRVMSVLRDDQAPARSVVAASWRRSLTLYGLDPAQSRPPVTVTESELRHAREEMEPLLRAGQGPLDRLFQAVGAAGCCVLLTHRNGVPVDRRGVAADDKEFHRLGLWPGAVWSEACEGTNGIGTSLAEGRALTIHHDQHFRSRYAGLSCSVAPVYDPSGRLAGALDVSSCRADLTEGLVGLIAAAVADAARSIEALAFRDAYSHARILLAPAMETRGAALLAVDAHDLVIGATRQARLAFGITDDRIAAQLPAADILSGPSPEDLAEAERGVVLRALARAAGNVSAAARALGISRATLHRKLNRLGLADHG